MLKLSDREWKKFQVQQIFTFKNGTKKGTKNSSGDWNLVSCSQNHNGVVGKCNTHPYSKCITVATNGAGLGSCFWQEQDFDASPDVLILFNDKLNKYNALFICTILSKQLKAKYTWFNKNKGSTTLLEQISLPIAKNCSSAPDWKFMEDYMKEKSYEIIPKCASSLVKMLKKTIPNLQPINEDAWKEYKIGDLFDCNATQTNEIGKFKKGHIPFICASNLNNGIQGYVEPNEGTEVEEGNCITVSSIDGTCFYQKNAFVGRGHGSVNVIRHKRLNKYNSIFICTCIKTQTKGKFNYSEQLFLNALKKLVIKLPSTHNGDPDWIYMENYIKNKHIN